MSEFVKLKQLAVETHRKRYFAQFAQAEENRVKEYNAAVLIQSVWRRFAAQKMINHWHESATNVQRVYKGYMVRKYRRLDAIETLRQRRHTAYHGGATRIQSLWRGYKSRKETKDMAARRVYLEQVKDGCAIMQDRLDQYVESRKSWEKEQVETKRNNEYQDRLDREHYMLSTTQKPGVYAKAKADVKEEDLINHMKTTKLKELRRKSLPSRSLRGTMRSFANTELNDRARTATATFRKPKGPFKDPADVWKMKNRPLNMSLRAETDFDAGEKAAITRRQKEWVKRIHEKGFRPAVAKGAPFSPYSRDLASSGRYTGNQPPEFRDDQPSKAFSVPHKPIPVFDDYGYDAP